jgi:hypothetical protein
MPTAHKLLSILFLLFCTAGTAQQSGSIHIQAENERPFYIQWKGDSYSSSPKGSLAIIRVPAGEQALLLSFPGEPGQYLFTCKVSDQPVGFSLKQGIDNQWSFFDMVNFTVNRVALATGDQVLAANAKPVPASLPLEPASGVSAGGVVTNREQPARPPGVRKIFDKSSTGGIDQVYIVVNGARADTVPLFIPVLEEPARQTAARVKPTVPAAETVLSAAFILAPPRKSLFSK